MLAAMGVTNSAAWQHATNAELVASNALPKAGGSITGTLSFPGGGGFTWNVWSDGAGNLFFGTPGNGAYYLVPFGLAGQTTRMQGTDGSTSGMSGCPSGAVSTNDTRYLVSLTNNAISGTDSVGTVVVGGQVTTVGSTTPWLHNITNELSIAYYSTIATNTALPIARMNESQTLTQLVTWAQAGTATGTVYGLTKYTDAISVAAFTANVSFVSGAWTTNNINWSIPAGGGLGWGITNGYLTITNAAAFIRTVTP
jgi:hypothetical protein